MGWRYSSERWGPAHTNRWNPDYVFPHKLKDIEIESPDKSYLAVLYQRGEYRMGWTTGHLAVLGGSPDEPVAVFQCLKLHCMANPMSAQWLTNGRYLAIEAHMFDQRCEPSLQLPFLFLDMHTMQFAFYPIMNSSNYRIEEHDRFWLLKEKHRDERFISHDDDNIYPDRLKWLSMNEIEDGFIRYFEGYFGYVRVNTNHNNKPEPQNNSTFGARKHETMNDIEENIRRLLARVCKGFRPAAKIEIDITEHGCSYRSTYVHGLFRKHTEHTLPSGGQELMDLIIELSESAQSQSRGHFYKCVIYYAKKQCDFHYRFENEDIGSIDDLALTIHGDIPRFYMKKRFSQELIERLPANKFSAAISVYISNIDAAKTAIKPDLLRAYALIDWLFTASRYGMREYFIRETDECELYGRKELCDWILEHLDALDDDHASSIFTDAIAICAKDSRSIDRLRSELGVMSSSTDSIEAVNQRFFDSKQDIEQRLFQHIKSNPQRYSDD